MKFKAIMFFIVCMFVFSDFAFADDHGNWCNTATSVSLNTSREGNIETAGDIDFFRVDVPSSGTLTVYTTGNTDTYGSWLTGYCYGMANDDDSGENSNFQISITVNSGTSYNNPGTFYFLVRHYSPGGTGAYTLNVQFVAGGGDDHGNSCSTATTMSLNTSRSGNIETGGDYDLFRVDVPSSGTLTVYTTGSTDTYGGLGNSGCSAIEWDDDDGDGNNFYIRRSVTAGTYYVAVLHYSSSRTGAYTLNVQFGGDGTAKVGVEWTSGSCESCRANAEGFYNTMISNGSIGRFNNGGDAARASHFTNEDALYVDAVDMVYFSGHGRSQSDAAGIFFDYPVSSVAKSIDMILGDGDLKWLVLYACETLKNDETRNVFNNWRNSFRGLHMILGFHSNAQDYPTTTAEVGEDFADALNDGETICEAWMDASWDWVASIFRRNKPACLSAEPNSGSNNTVDNDHFLGKGVTVSNPYPFHHLTLTYVE